MLYFIHILMFFSHNAYDKKMIQSEKIRDLYP